MSPCGYGPGLRYEKGGGPRVYWTNFQGSHRLKQRLSKKERLQEQERSETNLSTTVQRFIVVDYSYSALKIYLTGPVCTMDGNHCSVFSVRKHL